MSLRISKLGVVCLVGLAAIGAFIVLSPKNESPNRNASTPSERPEAGQPDAPSPAVPTPSDALGPDITLDLNVNGNDQRPILNVTTNLPPKTLLMATLVNPINQGGDGYFGQVSAAVQTNQVVQFGPFSKNEDALSPGSYKLTVITIMAAGQPEEVRPFFGAHGERLSGPQVFTLPGTSEKGISQTFQFTINPDGSQSHPLHSPQPAP